MRRNEELEVVLAELRARGLKPTHKHGGKHIKVEWDAWGTPQSVIVPVTSSDARARLNLRAQVRGMIKRAAEVAARKPSRPAALKLAMALPEHRDTIGDRLTRIENELNLLVDLIVELLPDARRRTRREEPVPRRTAEQKILEIMSFTEAMTRAEISERSGVGLPTTGTVLSIMRRMRLVRSASRGRWIRCPMTDEQIRSMYGERGDAS